MAGRAIKKHVDNSKKVGNMFHMTISEAKNKIIAYLVKNQEASVLDVSMLENLGLGDAANPKDVVVFNAAMKELEEIKIFKKEVTDKGTFWVLYFKIGEQDQRVEVSYPLIDAIARTVEQYVKTNGNNDYAVDRTALSEQDIAMLLYIISDLMNNLQKENS